jgi:hypothetical protein
MNLDNVSIGRQFSRTTHFHIFLTGIFGKSPFERFQNLLPSGKLEFATTNGFNDVRFVNILAADREEDLSNIDARRHANGLSVTVTHATGETIGPGATQHFIGAKNMKGMGSHFNVKGILANGLSEMLVNGHTAGLEGFAGNLLLFVANEVSDKGKEIDGSLFGADIKDANLTVGDTTAVATLDVRLVLLVTVATSWTATHDDKFDSDDGI